MNCKCGHLERRSLLVKGAVYCVVRRKQEGFLFMMDSTRVRTSYVSVSRDSSVKASASSPSRRLANPVIALLCAKTSPLYEGRFLDAGLQRLPRCDDRVSL